MATLPGIGRRTAMRLVIDLMKRDKEEVKRFAEAFIEMAEGIQNCKVCGNLSDHSVCAICEDERRDSSILCIVEDIRDILAIEATQSFKGKYHVLGGIISPMDGIGPSDLNIPSLLERVNEGSIKEVIFALSATMEGDTTNFYLFRKLKDSPIFISSLSRGVAVGAELQYADEITLSRSILNRQPFTI